MAFSTIYLELFWESLGFEPMTLGIEARSSGEGPLVLRVLILRLNSPTFQ